LPIANPFQEGSVAMDKSSKKTEATERTPQAVSQPKIVWDDSNMRSVYDNVAGTRKEIVLLFGMNQA
jgi:hypothetical protein